MRRRGSSRDARQMCARLPEKLSQEDELGVGHRRRQLSVSMIECVGKNAGNLLDLLNMHAQSIRDSARSLIESSAQTHGLPMAQSRSRNNKNATPAHSNSSLVAFCARSLSLSSEYYEKYIFFLYDMANVYAIGLLKEKIHESRSQPHFHLFYKHINSCGRNQALVYRTTIPEIISCTSRTASGLKLNI